MLLERGKAKLPPRGFFLRVRLQSILSSSAELLFVQSAGRRWVLKLIAHH